MRLFKWPLLLLVVGALSYGTLAADTVARLTTWQTGDVLDAEALNAEFDNLVNVLNGQIDKNNIDSTTLIVIDTLAVRRGMKFGTTHSTTLGNVIWGNGSLFVAVTKDSAGIVDKTSRQSITGVKIFANDTTTFNGLVYYGSEVTMSSTLNFAVLPQASAELFPTLARHLTNKWYVDSMFNVADSISTAAKYNAVDSTARDSVQTLQGDINTLDIGQTIARDSIQTLQDSVDAAAIRITNTNTVVDSMGSWTVLDTLPAGNLLCSGTYIYGTAGDTTSPGKAYKRSSTPNRWLRADTSVSVVARAMAMDSVNKGGVCRFLLVGTFRNDAWDFQPDSPIFNDTITAGGIDTTVRAAPKKMQRYGTALSGNVILWNPDGTIAY
jgi:hypothetical protein